MIIHAVARTPVQRADQHDAGAQRAAQLGMRAADAAAEGRRDAYCPLVYLTQHVPAHGEHNGFRSMILLLQIGARLLRDLGVAAVTLCHAWLLPSHLRLSCSLMTRAAPQAALG